jgi:FAD/FMN-containing dehydrogenase
MIYTAEAGRLTAQSGVTFDEILRVAIPRGWFLPLTPGTRFVTIGGAVANDVHGKNSTRAGAELTASAPGCLSGKMPSFLVAR